MKTGNPKKAKVELELMRSRARLWMPGFLRVWLAKEDARKMLAVSPWIQDTPGGKEVAQWVGWKRE